MSSNHPLALPWHLSFPSKILVAGLKKRLQSSRFIIPVTYFSYAQYKAVSNNHHECLALKANAVDSMPPNFGPTRVSALKICQKKLSPQDIKEFPQIPPIKFNSLDFCMALLKTEVVSFQKDPYTLLTAISTYFDFTRYFTLDGSTSPNLFSRSSYINLGDFIKGHKSARVGEAVAFLYMDEFGYSFFNRCDMAYLAAYKAYGLPSAEALERLPSAVKKNLKGNQGGPDFIFCNKKLKFALMESKGHNIKGDTYSGGTLKPEFDKALEQLSSWSDAFGTSSTPQQFAIGTYIRSEGTGTDGTRVVVVDPEASDRSPPDPIPVDPIFIVRSNYEMWLRLMGCPELADYISPEDNTPTREGIKVSLQQIELGNHVFAFASDPFFDRNLRRIREIEREIKRIYVRAGLSSPSLELPELFVPGISWTILGGIIALVRGGDIQEFMRCVDEFRKKREKLVSVASSGDRRFQCSITGDGAFLGLLPFREMLEVGDSVQLSI